MDCDHGSLDVSTENGEVTCTCYHWALISKNQTSDWIENYTGIVCLHNNISLLRMKKSFAHAFIDNWSVKIEYLFYLKITLE